MRVGQLLLRAGKAAARLGRNAAQDVSELAQDVVGAVVLPPFVSAVLADEQARRGFHENWLDIQQKGVLGAVPPETPAWAKPIGALANWAQQGYYRTYGGPMTPEQTAYFGQPVYPDFQQMGLPYTHWYDPTLAWLPTAAVMAATRLPRAGPWISRLIGAGYGTHLVQRALEGGLLQNPASAVLGPIVLGGTALSTYYGLPRRRPVTRRIGRR